jgi:hypothetical protein
MPRKEELPSALASLAFFNAIEIRHDRFKSDFLHLVRSIAPRTLDTAMPSIQAT